MLKKTRDYYAADRSEMLRFVPLDAKRVLEVGCGEGRFGAALKAINPREVWGVELSPGAAECASKVLDRVIPGDFSAIVETLPEAFFDCVIFNDVLEHLIDPFQILQQVKRILTTNGDVALSLPNVRYIKNVFNFLVKKDWCYQDHGILDYTHFHFFTKKSILRMFEGEGYNVSLILGINPTCFPFFGVFNFLTFGLFGDTKHMQYACVAHPRSNNRL